MKSVKYYTFAAMFLFVSSAPGLFAQSSNMHFNDREVEGEVVERIHKKGAEFGMTTNEGSVDLMIIRDGIAIQFSDRFLANLEKEINEESSEGGDGPFVKAIKAAVSSGVSSLLDHALVIPDHEMSNVYYNNGRLYIINHDGEDIFEDVEINDTEVMEDFSRRQARRFADILGRRIL